MFSPAAIASKISRRFPPLASNHPYARLIAQVLRDQQTIFKETTQSLTDQAGLRGHGLETIDHLKRAIGRLGMLNQSTIMPPLIVEVHPTLDSCSAHCRRCLAKYLGADVKRPSSDRLYFAGPEGIARANRLVENVAEYWKEWGIRGEMKLSGSDGDPTQLGAVIRAFAEAAQKYGIDLWVFTGGMKNRVLWEWDIHKLANIYMSWDGLTKETIAEVKGIDGRIVEESFDFVGRMLREKAADRKMLMGYVVTEENIDEAERSIQMAEDLGYDGFRAKVDFTRSQLSVGSFSSKVEALLRLIKEKELVGQGGSGFSLAVPLHPMFMPSVEYIPGYFFGYCSAPFATATISKWGTLHPCYHAPSSAPFDHLGYLGELSFKELWTGMERIGQLTAWPKSSCKLCPSSAWFTNNFIATREQQVLSDSSLFLLDIRRRIWEENGG